MCENPAGSCAELPAQSIAGSERRQARRKKTIRSRLRNSPIRRMTRSCCTSRTRAPWNQNRDSSTVRQDNAARLQPRTEPSGKKQPADTRPTTTRTDSSNDRSGCEPPLHPDATETCPEAVKAHIREIGHEGGARTGRQRPRVQRVLAPGTALSLRSDSSLSLQTAKESRMKHEISRSRKYPVPP